MGEWCGCCKIPKARVHPEMLPTIFLLALAGQGLFAQNVTPRDVDDFCWNLRSQLPVVRKEMQSPADARRKPGPRQTAPWYINGTGIVAAPSDTPQSDVPQSLYRAGRIERLTAQSRNGRVLHIGDAVWMLSSSCSTSPSAFERNLATLNMDLVTDKTFEFTRDGNTGVSTFVFQIRVPLLELMAMTGPALVDYMNALLPDDPPTAKPGGAPDSSASGGSNNSGATPRKVQLGDSRGRVEEILGQPETVADLGTKVVYVYRSLKITFVNGKVTDVQ